MDKKELYKKRLDAIQQKAQLANEQAQTLLEKTEKLKEGVISFVEKVAEDSKNKSIKVA